MPNVAERKPRKVERATQSVYQQLELQVRAKVRNVLRLDVNVLKDRVSVVNQPWSRQLFVEGEQDVAVRRRRSTKGRKRDPRLKRAGVSGFNKPKRTPGHKTKSHIVVAKVGNKIKTIRFGQKGAKTAGKPKAGESRRMKMKRKSFKARHRRNIAKGKMSAAYWANKVKW